MLDRMLPVNRRRNTPEERSPRTMWDMFEEMMEHPWYKSEGFGTDFFPSMDVREKGDELEVKAELPGIEPDDVDISIENNQLVIQGEKEEKKEDKEGRTYSECSYGAFYRSIPLGANVDEDKIKAKFKKGVLTVKIPRAEKDKGRKIAIES